ncbi:MAG: Rab family GTPase [Candidatus Thorarchaeota archaeon]
MSRKPDFVWKIILLGDTAVGKTSLVQRYVYDTFNQDAGRTIGAILHVKTINLKGRTYKLVIWDLGGEESFSELREQYCQHASGAIFVFDTTCPETLQNIDIWLSALHSGAGRVPVIMVENKIDLETKIPRKQVQEAQSPDTIKLVRTSALEDRNVDDAFHDLVRAISIKAVAQG